MVKCLRTFCPCFNELVTFLLLSFESSFYPDTSPLSGVCCRDVLPVYGWSSRFHHNTFRRAELNLHEVPTALLCTAFALYAFSPTRDDWASESRGRVLHYTVPRTQRSAWHPAGALPEASDRLLLSRVAAPPCRSLAGGPCSGPPQGNCCWGGGGDAQLQGARGHKDKLLQGGLALLTDFLQGAPTCAVKWKSSGLHTTLLLP